MMFKSINPAKFGFAAALIVATAAFSAPVALAQSHSDDTASAAPRMHSSREARGPEANVEKHIAGLKAKLRITSDEEPQWEALANVMRQNAQEAQTLIDQRNSGGTTLTAIDDLKNYEALAAEHAEGLKRMETAFEALYTAMPDDQKRNADMVFAKHEGRGEHHHQGHNKT
ncbi:MAG: periplasmic protein CpxP/Spy [Aliidongia sp.]|jgi:protein CpxP|nr:periplasmic protein CpxP/Spy [Aliidongia sp.]